MIKGKARKHGFETPYSVFQLISWVVALYIFISTCLSFVSLVLSHEEQKDEEYEVDMVSFGIITGIYLLAFLMMVILTAKVTKSDPTDPTVALERLARAAKEHGFAPLNFNASDY